MSNVIITTDTVLLLYVALFVAVLGLIIAAWSFHLARKSLHFSQVQCKKLMHDIEISQSGAMGMGKRILSMEKQVNQRRTDVSPANVASRPYSEASNLFSLGIDRDEVARRCSLSRAEASLLEAMQKHTSVS